MPGHLPNTAPETVVTNDGVAGHPSNMGVELYNRCTKNRRNHATNTPTEAIFKQYPCAGR